MSVGLPSYHTNNPESNPFDEKMDLSWMNGFSVKFHGCHDATKSNVDVSSERMGLRLYTKSTAIFRLCPTEQCHANYLKDSKGGCSSGYGEYVLDMVSFLTAYFNGRTAAIRNNNPYYNSDGTDVISHSNDYIGKKKKYDYQQEHAQHHPDHDAHTQSAASIGKNQDEDQYNNNHYKDYLSSHLLPYFECAAVPNVSMSTQEKKEDEGGRMPYFVGPYCAADGSSIRMGIFNDAACTIVTSPTQEEKEKVLAALFPLHSSNDANEDAVQKEILRKFFEHGTALVDNQIGCHTCEGERNVAASHESKNSNGNDDDDVSTGSSRRSPPNAMCQELYQKSGKCEQKFQHAVDGTSDHTTDIHENACEYLEHIHGSAAPNGGGEDPAIPLPLGMLSNKGGQVTPVSALHHSNRTGTTWIVILAMVILVVVRRRQERKMKIPSQDFSYPGHDDGYSLVELVPTDGEDVAS